MNRGTDLGQGAHEVALRRREGRIDEDHVHAGEPRYSGRCPLPRSAVVPVARRAYRPAMVVAAFVAPYLLEATARFVSVAAELPDVRLGLVTCEPVERIPLDLRRRLDGHWRVDDALDPRQLAWAVSGLARADGPGGPAGRGAGAAAGTAGAGP